MGNINIFIKYFSIGFLLCFLIFYLMFEGNFSLLNFKILNLKEITSILSGVIFEEILFRILILNYINRYFKNIYASIFVQALMFMSLHIQSYQSYIALFGYLIAGIYYGLYLFLSNVDFKTINKNYLGYSIGIHFAWNYFQKSNLYFPRNYLFESTISSLYCRILILIFTVLIILIVRIFSNKTKQIK